MFIRKKLKLSWVSTSYVGAGLDGRKRLLSFHCFSYNGAGENGRKKEKKICCFCKTMEFFFFNSAVFGKTVEFFSAVFQKTAERIIHHRNDPVPTSFETAYPSTICKEGDTPSPDD